MDSKDVNEIELVASRVRGKVISLSHQAKSAHLASALSCIDILAAAYCGVLQINPQDTKNVLRDRLILSKGHAATALYAMLAEQGFFPGVLLDTFNRDGSCLAEHPGPNCVPGVEAATGSLGHGLSLGLGMALAGKIQKQDYRVFVVLSDGECNEGSVWEAAMFAPAQQLDNVVAVIDYNKWQATGRSQEILSLNPLTDKWKAFNWDVHEIDGHDIGSLMSSMKRVPKKLGQPTAIIAHTVKGKGVSFMEDDNNWHYRIPTEEEVSLAHSELGLL
jgi:transketolase